MDPPTVPDILLWDEEALLSCKRCLAGGHRGAQTQSAAEGPKDLEDLGDQLAGGQDDQSAQARDDPSLQCLSHAVQSCGHSVRDTMTRAWVCVCALRGRAWTMGRT